MTKKTSVVNEYFVDIGFFFSETAGVMTKQTNKLTPLEKAEAEVWRGALLANQGSLRRACAALGKSRPTGLKKVIKYGLKPLTNNNAKYRRRA